ncbi:MAG: AAA family ATPase [Planctomycetia bacterium]
MDVAEIRERAARLRAQCERVVVGQGLTVERMLVALLANGHVLLEGVPGTAKTLLARVFSAGLRLAWRRIQFTPDLMPGDVLGTNLFDFSANRFVLTRGPIFTQVLLADEINRAPPKTQAALLEAMQERSVTMDGTTYPLGPCFFVVATQNPVEQEGTYPLPEAQLDRFLLKLQVGYPSREDERALVRAHGHSAATPPLDAAALEPVADEAWLVAARATVGALRATDEVVDYAVDLVRATRSHPSLSCGASPRAAAMLLAAARARAVLHGRDFVTPDDIKDLAVPALAHRLVLAPAAELEGHGAAAVLEGLLASVAAPR